MQIAEYGGGRQRIVQHIGSAHTEAELGVLLARARELLEDPAQGVLDLGIEPTPPVAPLVRPAAEPALLQAPREAPIGGRGGPGRVVGTDSRLLFETLKGVYAALGFGAVGDEVFRDLVIARVVEPTSIRDSARVLTDLGRQPASYATMKRTLARAAAGGAYRDQIATLCFNHALTSGDVSLVLYDVTTLLCRCRHNSVYADLLIMPMFWVSVQVGRYSAPRVVGIIRGRRARSGCRVRVGRSRAGCSRVGCGQSLPA